MDAPEFDSELLLFTSVLTVTAELIVNVVVVAVCFFFSLVALLLESIADDGVARFKFFALAAAAAVLDFSRIKLHKSPLLSPPTRNCFSVLIVLLDDLTRRCRAFEAEDDSFEDDDVDESSVVVGISLV